MTEFKKHAEHARIIFEDEKEPKIQKPCLERDFGYGTKFETIRKKLKDTSEKIQGAFIAAIDSADNIGFTEHIKNWRKDVRELKAFKASLCTILWGQCSDLMQSKLEAD